MLPAPQLAEVVQSDLDLCLAIGDDEGALRDRIRRDGRRIHQATHLVRLCAIPKDQAKIVHALVQRIPVLWPKVHLVHVHHQPRTVLRLHREHAVIVERRVPAMSNLEGILPGQEQVILLINQLPNGLDDGVRVAPLLERVWG